MRNTFLVCYDIANDLRLRKVHKTMRGFGDHLQYSIFECQFTPTDLVRCRHALAQIIHHKRIRCCSSTLVPPKAAVIA